MRFFFYATQVFRGIIFFISSISLLIFRSLPERPSVTEKRARARSTQIFRRFFPRLKAITSNRQVNRTRPEYLNRRRRRRHQHVPRGEQNGIGCVIRALRVNGEWFKMSPCRRLLLSMCVCCAYGWRVCLFVYFRSFISPMTLNISSGRSRD